MFRKHGLYVLFIAITGLFFSVTLNTPVFASGESYALNQDATSLKITGGNVPSATRLPELNLEVRERSDLPPGFKSYIIPSFGVKSGCPTGTGWLEAVLNTEAKQVTSINSGCGTFTTQDTGSTYPGFDTWDQGKAYSQQSGAPSGSARPSTSGNPKYTFRGEDGSTIRACGGIFNQFPGQCVDLKHEAKESVSSQDSGYVTTYPNIFIGKESINFSGGQCQVGFAVGIPNERSLIEGTKLAGYIAQTTMTGSRCGGNTPNNTNDDVLLANIPGPASNSSEKDPLEIEIGGADKLKSFLGQDVETQEAAESTCAINGVGWIVCPVMLFIGTLNDAAFEFLDDILQIRPALITSKATQDAWAAFRDIANVAFVIAFMIIVYSQLTSAGVSNYGVKKMLPRIVIAAILVNVSYVITAIAVDLSNIVGTGIYSLFQDTIAPGLNNTSQDGAWEKAIVGALALTTGFIALILLVMVIGPMALIALALVILILVARQALVILLIVAAPLAFVAYLLPNTEDWFKKWYKAFVAVLMVFPIVGLVFGASTLASRILSSVAASTEDANILQIVALGVLAVPLFAVPAILKGSLSAAGSVGAKIQNLANKTQGSAVKQGRKKFDNSMLGQYKNYRSNESNRRRAMMQAGVYNENGTEGSRFNPRNIRTKLSGALVSRTGKFGENVQATGASINDKIWDENVGNQQKFMANEQSLNPEQLSAIVNDSTESVERRAAAAGLIMKNGAMGDIHKLINDTQKMGKEASGIRKQMMGDMNRTPFGMGAGDIANMKRGEQMVDATGSAKDYDKMLSDRAEKKLSGGVWAGLDPDDQSELSRLAQSGKLSDKGLQNLVNATADAEQNDNIDIKDETKDHGQSIRQAASERGIVQQATTVSQSTVTPAPIIAPSPSFTGEQVRTMGARNTTSAVVKRGGVETLHESDLVAIRNAHGADTIGQEARQELVRRGVLSNEQKPKLP